MLSFVEPTCSFFETETYGQVQSLDINNDGHYENNVDCSWTIWSNDLAEDYVQLHFTSMDIQGGKECSNDYIKVSFMSSY